MWFLPHPHPTHIFIDNCLCIKRHIKVYSLVAISLICKTKEANMSSFISYIWVKRSYSFNGELFLPWTCFLFLTVDYKWSSSPVDAPSARALAMWPTFWMPPSAMTGTPKRLAYSDTLYTAVACGLPHASTDRGKINKSTIIQNKIHLHNYTTSDLHAQRKNVSRWPLSQHALCL